MNANDLIIALADRGIRLRTVAGEIQTNRPGDILPDEREQLRRLKSEIMGVLDRLPLGERQRLMEACANECRRNYTGQAIDFPAVVTINRKIGETFTRNELTTLLAQYEEAIWD